ncbi:sigma-70 family RNA polymerase sigma factor [Telluribacter sp.]|jgi:RNA polymerase sigma factor (sigma-70 family)|uniref:RNA polymerase sigma factor n=1 Tax=Telluribacter sp. TaxID=1978767 RepID=UPI002E13A1FD|nr:sigma-70 family RNA polymerase sigma factor [Telluribacter sp.]
MKQRLTIQEIQQLWLDYQSGDMEALATLMQAFYADLYNWGLRFVPEGETVRDCLQDVFLALWQKHGHMAVVQDVPAYLFKTVKHRLLQEYRRKSFTQVMSLTDEQYTVHVEFSADLRQIEEEHQVYRLRRLEQLMNQLPERQREIIYLRFYQNLEFDQIAEIMQIGKQPVYNLLHRALKNMRDYTLGTFSWLLVAMGPCTTLFQELGKKA